jgi:hypothetical protein
VEMSSLVPRIECISNEFYSSPMPKVAHLGQLYSTSIRYIFARFTSVQYHWH